MSALIHLLLFLVSAAIIWFFAGLLVESVDKVAKRYKQSGFTVAFFVLGLLTSISEISVMVNSTLNGTPEVSAGNLAGASFVILLFLVPILAIVGKGVQLKNTLHKRNLAIALFAVALPTLLLLDGNVTQREGLLCILLYGTLAYLIRRQPPHAVPKILEEVEEEIVNVRDSGLVNGLKILIGAICIFFAGQLLVDETVYFADALSIPRSMVGLVLLSIGTNIPELVIAIRSILRKHKDIAFGDYLGSTVANTLIFGVLAVFNGTFRVESSEFVFTAILMIIGFAAFYVAAKSKNKITKEEGLVLLSIYGIFFLIQIVNAIRFSLD